MLDAIVRLGVSWPRAKHWIVSPDPAYERKKTTVVKLTREAPNVVPTLSDTLLNHGARASTSFVYQSAVRD
jgi:hypothetical protein